MKTEMQDVRLQNLHPREPLYGETKKRRYYSTTDVGREGLAKLAASLSISEQEVIERLGRLVMNSDDTKKILVLLLTSGNITDSI